MFLNPPGKGVYKMSLFLHKSIILWTLFDHIKYIKMHLISTFKKFSNAYYVAFIQPLYRYLQHQKWLLLDFTENSIDQNIHQNTLNCIIFHENHGAEAPYQRLPLSSTAFCFRTYQFTHYNKHNINITTVVCLPSIVVYFSDIHRMIVRTPIRL